MSTYPEGFLLQLSLRQLEYHSEVERLHADRLVLLVEVRDLEYLKHRTALSQRKGPFPVT